MPEPIRPQPRTPTFLIVAMVGVLLSKIARDCMLRVVKSQRLRPQVILLGLVSMLNDSASEMIYPLLPVFLTTTLGATPLIVGMIEGSADALASILKLVAGTMSDRMPRRKPLIVTGYALAAISRSEERRVG